MKVENKIIRTGVYGVVLKNDKILLVSQREGIYTNKLDLPGGGIEFGETIEETLRREFIEEVNGIFTSMTHFDNITSTYYVPELDSNDAHTLHRVGLVYLVDGFSHSLTQSNTLEYGWFDIDSITRENASCFAYTVTKKLILEALPRP